eukprot:5714072-Pyramimonas_sp.AAC.2
MTLEYREHCFGMLQGLQTVVFQRGSSLSGNELWWRHVKRELGGRVYSIIVDNSWVSTGPPPPLHAQLGRLGTSDAVGAQGKESG